MKQPKIVFKKLPNGVLGMYYSSTDTVIIDLTQTVRVPGYVYVHEMIHRAHPNWLEDEVTTRAYLLWRSLTQYQRFKITKKSSIASIGGGNAQTSHNSGGYGWNSVQRSMLDRSTGEAGDPKIKGNQKG